MPLATSRDVSMKKSICSAKNLVWPSGELQLHVTGENAVIPRALTNFHDVLVLEKREECVRHVARGGAGAGVGLCAADVERPEHTKHQKRRTRTMMAWESWRIARGRSAMERSAG